MNSLAGKVAGVNINIGCRYWWSNTCGYAWA